MVTIPPSVETALFRAVMALPTPVVRRLAGRPVAKDGQVLDPETQWLLRVQRLVREPSLASLPVPDGRRALLRQARMAGGRQPVGETRELEVPTPAGPMRARLYVPTAEVVSRRGSAGSAAPRPPEGSAGSAAPRPPEGSAGSAAPRPPDGSEPAPLLVFLHGGGMIHGDLDSHDAPCRFLAERAGVRVLALDYRLAPEHRFPAGVEDAWAGYRWAVEHAAELGTDPDRTGVGGDSAGGMLSALVALQAAREGVPRRFQLLFYPVTDFAEVSRSRQLFTEGFYLDQAYVDLAEDSYLAPSDDRRDPRVSVLYTDPVPAGLAPAVVVTAGFDPLRDEGEAFARRLSEHGVEVELRRYPGLIHGFLNTVGTVRSARAAVGEVAARLKARVG